MKMSWESQSVEFGHLKHGILLSTRFGTQTHTCTFCSQMGMMPSDQEKFEQAPCLYKRCLWNTNVIKFGFHMGKVIETNEQIHHRLMACERTQNGMNGLNGMECCLCSSNIEGWRCGKWPRGRMRNWVMTKSGVNISLKLFDIETNINGMTLFNPFGAATAAAATTELILIHNLCPCQFFLFSYSCWKSTLLPFDLYSSLSSSSFLVHNHLHTHSETLIPISFISHLTCPTSPYLFNMSTEWLQSLFELMNNLWMRLE